MIVYTATFARHDGTEFAEIGTYSDVRQAQDAIADYAHWRAEVSAPAGNGLIAPPALSWRHYAPAPHRGRYHELYVARNDYLDYFLVHRTELGERPWRQEATAARVRNGSLVPPVWALDRTNEPADGAGQQTAAAAP